MQTKLLLFDVSLISYRVLTSPFRNGQDLRQSPSLQLFLLHSCITVTTTSKTFLQGLHNDCIHDSSAVCHLDVLSQWCRIGIRRWAKMG